MVSWETETHLRARDGCHMSTLRSRGVTSCLFSYMVPLHLFHRLVHSLFEPRQCPFTSNFPMPTCKRRPSVGYWQRLFLFHQLTPQPITRCISLLQAASHRAATFCISLKCFPFQLCWGGPPRSFALDYKRWGGEARRGGQKKENWREGRKKIQWFCFWLIIKERVGKSARRGVNEKEGKFHFGKRRARDKRGGK